MAGLAIEMGLAWAPWMAGMASGIMNVYHARDFPADEIEGGDWHGSGGHATVALSGAVLALHLLFVVQWMRHLYKTRNGKLQTRGGATPHPILRAIFNVAILCFSVLCIAMSFMALNVAIDFNGYDVRVNNDGTLGGDIGIAMLGLSASVVSLGMILFVMHTVNEVLVRQTGKPQYVETHDYVL